jgi:aromatic-L-amino-acid decarboxylase
MDMDSEAFRKYGHQLVDWMADYLDRVEDYPVKSPLKPGEVLAKLPAAPPEEGEAFESLFSDFESLILPGITHWQHPSFFAYFPANSSRISVLAEMLTSTLAAQCMIWQTSPAAAELEERVMTWLRDLLGLPAGWSGVIQDTASTATLCSLLTARERATELAANTGGLHDRGVFTTYCSQEGHSSYDKAVKIAGLGQDHLRRIAADAHFAMIPEKLEEAVRGDLDAGLRPLCVMATLGTTSSTAVDPLRAVGEICRRHGIWLHVDAAMAGSALILPEMQWMIDGIEHVDTFVFNPHKWMFTNFDCSAYFVKDPGWLIRTFEILPEYLKTREGDRVNNYRDWGIPLGRRFRALKLWFVIRHYGVEGLRAKIRNHIDMARDLAQRMEAAEDFELLAPRPLNTLCFRYKPAGLQDEAKLNRLNEVLIERLNDSGKVYLTHTKLRGRYTLRMVIGQTEVEQRHVDRAWSLIQAIARGLHHGE